MSLDKAINDVVEFHKEFGLPVRTVPQIPLETERALRYDLLDEEMDELGKAWAEDDLVEITDALTDIIYVAIGMALSYGIPLAEVWNEVHLSNMEKLGGGLREDGKILKPKGWVPPRVKEILLVHGYTD